MTTALINALGEKMNWLEANQKELARNISNADTPGYRPNELKQPDFKNILSNTTSMSTTPHLATTNAKHIDANGNQAAGFKESVSKKVYETAPAGNAVVLEEQLVKMNKNFTDHAFITNLYQKQFDFLKTAIKGGSGG